MTGRCRTPGWVWAIIAGMAAMEPAMHLWLKYGLRNNIAPTGFHIGDTPFFLTAMSIFKNGFFSPYAVCESAAGSHSATYFALPHHWVYGALGLLAAILRMDPFILLGFANALCGAAYLWAAYRFLRAIAPERANMAFILFTLAGGVGGVLYVAAGPLQALGAYPPGGFQIFFHRYARYELIEGPFISPWLVFPRLYYTLPLALGFASLTLLIRNGLSGNARDARDARIASAVIFLAAYLNARLGLMFAIIAIGYLYAQTNLPLSMRLKKGAWYILPILLAAGLVSLQFRANPTGVQNVNELLRRCAWFGSMISLLFWHLFTVPLGIQAPIRALPTLGRMAAYAGIGFLSSFALLYGVHQVYFGNLLTGGDTAAAIAVSDWALLGAATGAVWGIRKLPGKQPDTDHLGWVAMWFLGFLCIAVSALFQGRLLTMMPERFLALLGVPLALLSAEGLARWRAMGKPRIAAVLLTGMLACGICSVAVAALCFQLPGKHPAVGGPFRWVHSEIMHPLDRRLLDVVPEGVLLAPASDPPLLGDVAVCSNPRLSTVFGQPSLEFGGVEMLPTARRLQQFYAPETTDAERRALARDYCVNYVLCPATWPVNSETLRQLQTTPWLESVMQENGAALFRVRKEALHE